MDREKIVETMTLIGIISVIQKKMMVAVSVVALDLDPEDVIVLVMESTVVTKDIVPRHLMGTGATEDIEECMEVEVEAMARMKNVSRGWKMDILSHKRNSRL